MQHTHIGESIIIGGDYDGQGGQEEDIYIIVHGGSDFEQKNEMESSYHLHSGI